MTRKPPISPEESLGWAVAACALAVVGQLIPIPSAIELYSISPGTPVRPMGYTMAMFFGGILCPVGVFVGVFRAWRCPGISRRLAAAAAIISIATLPLHMFLLRWIVAAHQLMLEP